MMKDLADYFLWLVLFSALWAIASELDDIREYLKIQMIEDEVCTQHTDYKHCVDGTQITFNGGIK